ncbi:cytochrome c [Phreatobacter aquaticus]|uniref:Cytochrome c n=1 Tax=Phreatobacter aquaticus TaxID=2570229 RepID=A0A4D7QKD6_9HYPH|nr:cytochrome c [Phreatobacter aquaticus]QCK84782.1 cytochrome c [Phreatobacter aquaticus]
MPPKQHEVRRPRRVLAALVLLAGLGTGSAQAQTPLERGRYLMNGIVACGNCHTPIGPQGPVAGQELAGRLLADEPPFTAYASNITPDPETGIGRWTDEQIILAIREGKRPDGSIIGPPMPIELYRGMADEDVRAIAAYLRAVPPVRNAVPRSIYRIPLPPNYGPPVGSVPRPLPAQGLAYGAYLAGPLGHCTDCHSARLPTGGPDLEKGLGAGGMPFAGPWGISHAANLTPTGLSRWSDAQVKAMITTGVRPDGSRMNPPMGYGFYATMTTADLDALVAYLRSLPPK